MRTDGKGHHRWPSGEIVVKPGETVDINVGAGPGAVDLNITHYRIYTSTQVGVYQLCTQVNNAGTVATDTPVGVTSVVDQTPDGSAGRHPENHRLDRASQ